MPTSLTNTTACIKSGSLTRYLFKNVFLKINRLWHVVRMKVTAFILYLSSPQPKKFISEDKKFFLNASRFFSKCDVKSNVKSSTCHWGPSLDTMSCLGLSLSFVTDWFWRCLHSCFVAVSYEYLWEVSWIYRSAVQTEVVCGFSHFLQTIPSIP
jgi:hypothetical protein